MSAKEYRQLMGMDIPDFDTGNKHKNKKAPDGLNKNKVVRGNAVNRDSVTRSKKPRNDEEDQLTIQVADYCELLMVQKKISAYSHIPQETFTKSWAVKNKNKAMGVRAGVPDMLIVFPDKVLFLELKRAKGGRVSDAQKFWIEALSGVKGSVFATVASGWDEAKKAIDDLLE